MAQDYYKALGIERTASADEIKRAYRKLAHKYHPDKGGGDEEKFKEINEAYQVLGDDKKRAHYDQFGDTHTQGGAGGAGWQGFNVNFEDLGGMDSIFEQFFGGGARPGRQQVRRGSDVEVDTTISFKESATGVKKDVSLRLQQVCDHCHGNGAEPGTPIKECATCRGSGQVTTTRQTMFGVFAQAAVCPTCHGEGKQAQQKCRECRGEGRQMKNVTLEVSIPPGIGDKQTIRLSGRGEAARGGGVAGDLYVTVHVTPDKHLRREGNDVRSQAAIPFTDAALGTTITVPTLSGDTELAIPAGTQPGTQQRLSKQGFPVLGGTGRGDHIVTINVEIPRKLSRQQRQLLEQFKNAKKKKGLFS